MKRKDKTTAPKPFVFVMMPFSSEFSDVYEFGIRGAADEAGAYAERVDDQIFTEGILDRIFNQINKADVIVADMSGRNPNVFYEVGYAHALGKTVLLLTQSVDDIPFDLKHRPHIVYEGRIADLRAQLAKRIKWAIVESQKQASNSTEKLASYIDGQRLPEAGATEEVPLISLHPYSDYSFNLSLEVRNESAQIFAGSSHVYILSERDAVAVPCKVRTTKIRRPRKTFFGEDTDIEEEVEEEDYHALRPIPLPEYAVSDTLCIQFKLPIAISLLPPHAVDQLEIPFQRAGQSFGRSRYRLRVHSSMAHYDFNFCLEFKEPKKSAQEERVSELADQIVQSLEKREGS